MAASALVRALGAAADAYLATQGDVWDTQWDMFCCLIGALLAQLLLSRAHDHQLRSAGREAVPHQSATTGPAR